MRAGFLAGVVALIVTGVGLAGIQDSSERPSWISRLQGSSEAADDVLVLVVGSATRVGMVRSAVESERVVAETAEAFAIAEGRIISASIEAAAIPLMRAGWADRRLEIVTSSSLAGRAGGAAASGPGLNSASLLTKRTLTHHEAMQALSMMDASGAF